MSPEGLTKRVAMLDNVKTLRFSWAELESMITAPLISGKRMYHGEGQRPNNLTWIITLNGLSLSTDMAQRAVVIKIRKPKHTGTWAEETRAYMNEHRQEIIADILTLLKSNRGDLAEFTRWGAWERDVLSRLPEPSDAQAVILERQAAVDVELEEGDVIEDFFQTQLSCLGCTVTLDRVFIPSNIVAKWYNQATNENHSVIGVSRLLSQKIDERKMTHIAKCQTRSYGRGFLWIGESADPGENLKTDIETRVSVNERR